MAFTVNGTRQGRARACAAWPVAGLDGGLGGALAAGFVGALLGGCASTGAGPGAGHRPQAAVVSTAPTAPAMVEWASLSRVETEPVWIGGQPGPEALDAFRAAGGTTVINLRTDEEMAGLPYYEAAVRGKGLRYVSLPTTGDGLGRAHAQSLREALDRADGPVLLHCASGTRATYAFAMNRIEEGVFDAAGAAAWCRARGVRPWAAGDLKLYEYAGQTPPAELVEAARQEKARAKGGAK